MNESWQNSRSYADLESYVGKRFYLNFNEVDIVCLLGGEAGPPFFLCKWVWSDHVYRASVLDVLPHFDDNKTPIKDFDLPE